MADYLAVPAVPAVSGSWMVDPALLRAGDWAEVTARSADAVARATPPRDRHGRRRGGDHRERVADQAPRVRWKPSGITRWSGVSSSIDESPSPRIAESMPPRRMSRTFSTPAWPFTARPHR